MSSPQDAIAAISGPGGAGMTFDVAVASDVLSDLSGLQNILQSLQGQAQELVRAARTGDFTSGNAIQASLLSLGQAAITALNRIFEICQEVSTAIQNAAKNLLAQESENNHVISQAAVQAIADRQSSFEQFKADPIGSVLPWEHPSVSYEQALSVYRNGVNHPKATDAWPDISNRHYTAKKYNDKYIPGGADSGTYPTGASPENVAGPILDMANFLLSSADGPKVQTLAALWRGIADDLLTALDRFNSRSKSHMEDHNKWSGNAKDAIYKGLQDFTARSGDIGREMARIGNATSHFGVALGQTKPGIQALFEERQKEMVTLAASPATAAAVAGRQEWYEQQARDLMTAFYNPGVATAATGMSYISDPHNPVASAPLLVPGMTPPPAPQGSKGASGPVPKALQTQSTATSPGSTNTGSSKSSGSSGSAQLTRAGNADAVAKDAAAKTAAAQQAAAQQAAAAKAGAGNPASAAQSAASQAAQAGKGLSGLGQNGAATKSAGALANAEKAAAERAAKAAAAMGKGGGGGGAGGGLGGAAAAEKALQARAGSMGAAEKMVAAEQAALQNGRAGSPGMNGAPMGGARPGGEGGEGKGHKAARYLNSKANGEEIVGDEQEVAPTVIGGLNLDTTDDRPVRGGGTPPRR